MKRVRKDSVVYSRMKDSDLKETTPRAQKKERREEGEEKRKENKTKIEK